MATQSRTGEWPEPSGEPGQGGSAGVAGTVKQAAGGAVEQVRKQTRSRADQQREGVAAGLASVADAMRRMAEGLNEEQNALVRYAAWSGEALAGRFQRTSEYLRGHDIGQIAGEIENFARRRPALFLGAAFLAGLAATRFLKSSRPSEDTQRWSQPPDYPAVEPASGI